VMAVAAHVFDSDPPPPVLVKAWDYQSFGVDLLSLPAGELNALRLATNAHQALRGYTQASGHTVEWTNRNPSAWNLVSAIIEARRKELERKRQQDG